MKNLYKLGICVVGLNLVISCSDYQPLEFEVEKPESVALQEELNSYGSLKSYLGEDVSDFKLGGAVSISEYNSKGIMYRLINSNFEEVTPGYGMKHGAVVQGDGTLDLTSVTEFISNAEEAGISVYGHTLTWHANQNASYLNNLLAPLVIETPSFLNALDNTGLLDGSLTGYDYNVPEEAVGIAENEGIGEGNQAIKLTAPNGSSEAGDLQFTTPDIPVEEAATYEVVFFIRSDSPAQGRISFEGLVENNPLIDYSGSGELTESFQTDFSWQEVRFTVTGFQEENFKINFDLGFEPGVTYYIDVNNFYVYNPDGEPVSSNLVENGDFETGAGWGGWGNNSTRGITEAGEGVEGSKAFYVTNPSLTGGFWEVQTVYEFPEPLENGETYNLSFWVRGDAEGVIRPELQSPNYSSDGFGQVHVTQDWKKVELATTVTADDRQRLIFSYGEFAGTVFIDNVSLSNAAGGGGTTTILERTMEAKQSIVEQELERWISGMMTNAAYVDAWDVVNEPMDDGNPFELKSAATDSDIASDEFYWQDYLGKDYAVKAFELAREYGDADDVLFINDYNLEYNLDKTRGLIQYVEYIEEQGATVDGIGTQMHIGINSDKDKIAEMFQLLAETGKLIKVSELDVRTDASEATDEVLQAQAEMYRYVVEAYNEYVPAEQQYGITVWGVTDSPDDANWMPGEFQGLWDVDLNRKPAYASFAEALENL